MLVLEAGQAAGGDKRGKQSAALKVYNIEEYPWLDLRVDEHRHPVAELRRVLRGRQAAAAALHRRDAVAQGSRRRHPGGGDSDADDAPALPPRRQRRRLRHVTTTRASSPISSPSTRPAATPTSR